MKRAMLLLPIVALLLGCASSGEPDASSDDDFSLPPPSDGLIPLPGKSGMPGLLSVTGVLDFDTIEGGCAALVTTDGTRYEVIYPTGWSIDRATAELRGPGGQVVPPGAEVTVTGSIATDRASICQIGPIFVATEVLVPGS